MNIYIFIVTRDKAQNINEWKYLGEAVECYKLMMILMMFNASVRVISVHYRVRGRVAVNLSSEEL